ncbi:MAG: gfo/Idh/MocA family oxidoreductase, partial [Opitutales bacterium]
GAHPLDQLQWWADEVGLDIPVEYNTTGSIAEGPLFNSVDKWSMKASYANGLQMDFMDSHTAKDFALKLPASMQEPLLKHNNGTMFVGTEGWVCVSRGVLSASSNELRQKAKDPGSVRLPVSRNHFSNFADSVLSREQPIAPLDSAFRSDIISHLGDIGIRTGETLRWDPKNETLVGSADALKMMHRPMRPPWTL